ncbi:uncharacterized protein LOC110037485 [Phalaenopsis equestris]|uniref:uncharacterized protein LOC110037485 n=1 Tax=Phalaenopsis equestris TaxID=78828 RepID=UPI0009E583C8|nr:uncharacterized protein LOC110037485 [Phalaenopsis equestris]
MYLLFHLDPSLPCYCSSILTIPCLVELARLIFLAGFIQVKTINMADADGNKQLQTDQNEKVEELNNDPETVGHKEQTSMPSSEDEEAAIKKKYGGILPKKPQLISKDHERAYFDSADWALGKQGVKPKGPLEALRPKLQPTPQQQARSRRSAYASADGEGIYWLELPIYLIGPADIDFFVPLSLPLSPSLSLSRFS